MTTSHFVFYAANAGAISSCESMVMSKPHDVICNFYIESALPKSLTSRLEHLNCSQSTLLGILQASTKSTSAVVLGPQHDARVTQRILGICRALGRPTILITDHWGRNYQSIAGDAKAPHFPTLILAIDRSVTDELTSQGIDPRSIVEVGHLGIHRKKTLIAKLARREIASLWHTIGNPRSHIILLALEVIIDTSVDGSNQYWMIDELDNALRLIDATDATVVVRPHPSDNRDACKAYIEGCQRYTKFVLCPEYVADWETVALAKVAIGSNSTILALSAISGVSSIVLTYGVGARNTIPWLREYCVQTASELSTRLKQTLAGQSTTMKSDVPANDSPGNAWAAIRTVIEAA